MIKKAVFENDLILGMQRELQAHDKKVAMANLDQAGEYLHSAMEILESEGFTAQADRVFYILEKIASKTKPLQEIPNLQVFFDSGKFTPEDMKAAMEGDTEAVAKINVGMHEHGMSDHKIAEFLGKHYMPYHMAKKLLQQTYISGLKNYQLPSPKPGEEIVLSPVSPTESKEMGDQEIVMKSLLASAADELDARHKPHKPKDPRKIHDPHIPKSYEQEVRNYEQHGWAFNLSDDGKADTLLEVELADDNNLEVVDEGHDPAEKTFEDES